MGNISTQTNSRIWIFHRFVAQDLKINWFVKFQPLEALIAVGVRLQDVSWCPRSCAAWLVFISEANDICLWKYSNKIVIFDTDQFTSSHIHTKNMWISAKSLCFSFILVLNSIFVLKNAMLFFFCWWILSSVKKDWLEQHCILSYCDTRLWLHLMARMDFW